MKGTFCFDIILALLVAHDDTNNVDVIWSDAREHFITIKKTTFKILLLTSKALHLPKAALLRVRFSH